MTDTRPEQQIFRRSPRAVRGATFNRRMRGVDEVEVRAYLSGLADEIEAADGERAALRAEIDRLRTQLQSTGGPSSSGGGQPPAEINSHAVALFSQAQQVADRLVEEAVQHARDLMVTARKQQREILEKAHAAAEAAATKAAARAQSARAAPGPEAVPMPGPMPGPMPRPVAGPDLATTGGLPADSASTAGSERSPAAGSTAGLDPAIDPLPVQSISEVEYVRTFARVAQVQLKSVLDALAEQVDKLGQVPDVTEGRGDPPAPADQNRDDPLA